jgi:hypothetical protein
MQHTPVATRHTHTHTQSQLPRHAAAHICFFVSGSVDPYREKKLEFLILIIIVNDVILNKLNGFPHCFVA